jgi:predicted dinucleotide-binding enzyme
VYCGDEKRAKDVTARLIRDAGFVPLDAGPRQTARYAEPFALLVGQLAYQGDGGPKLAYRFERLGK